jgi:hypothetical protein
MECSFCAEDGNESKAEYLAPWTHDHDTPYMGLATLVFVPVCETHMAAWYLMTPPSERLPFVPLADDRGGVLHTWDRLKFDEVFEWKED